jgi:hypothetical protein
MVKTYTIADLKRVGWIGGPLYCTCLDDSNPYLGESGFCWFCEALERLESSQPQPAQEERRG